MKSIMYVGRKPKKADNKNENPNREWRGLGHVITNIPDLDGTKLAEHPDIWLDVTGWSPEQCSAHVKQLQEQRRREEREARKGQPVLLGTASDDELLQELKRRQSAGPLTLAPSTPVDQRPLTPVPGALGKERDEKERPDNTEDLAAEILGAVVNLSKEKGDFDNNGNPHLARVIAELGYTVTYDEVMAVWADIKE